MKDHYYELDWHCFEKSEHLQNYMSSEYQNPECSQKREIENKKKWLKLLY